MSWADAAAMAGSIIDAEFAEEGEITYTSAVSGVLPPFTAIRIDEPAAEFQGEGRNLRKITWEIPQAAIPGRASNRDSFTHAGRKWKVLEAERRDDIGKWAVVVQDEGPA